MPVKFDSIISDVIRREIGGEADGGYTNDPVDTGGRTQYGISEKENPTAWLDGKVTSEEARAIYLNKYVKWPKFDQIPEVYSKLQAQLIDFGVLSGPQLAIMRLQALLKVKVDGLLGPKTLMALVVMEPRSINNRLMGERLKMFGRIVKRDPSQVRFIEGWINRALEFQL